MLLNETVDEYVKDVFRFDTEVELQRVTNRIRALYPHNPEFIYLVSQLYKQLDDADKNRINASYKLNSPFGEDIRMGVTKLFEVVFYYYKKKFASHSVGFSKTELQSLKAYINGNKQIKTNLSVKLLRQNVHHFSLFMTELSKINNTVIYGLERFSHLKIIDDLGRLDKLLSQADDNDLRISKSFEPLGDKQLHALFYLKGFLKNKKLKVSFKKCEESLFELERLVSFVGNCKAEKRLN